MKNLYLSLCLSIGWLSMLSAQSISNSVKEYAQEKVRVYAQDYPGVSVSVSYQGKIAWNMTQGFLDLEKKIPVRRDTKFNIYSTSKFITGLAFLKLAYRGEIKDLDQKIREIDPGLPSHYNAITLRHLFTHRSGIRHYKGRKDWQNFSKLRCKSPAEAIK
ncbi:MAG: serine hydrolase domain-containing protein, partial [Bacteroidota bacterium]